MIAGSVTDLAGTTSRHVLADVLSDRRLRVCPRIVGRAIAEYQARGPNIDRASDTAIPSIDVLATTDLDPHPSGRPEIGEIPFQPGRAGDAPSATPTTYSANTPRTALLTRSE